MVKKILSIDFDIIMYPCIKMYNDKVGGDANSTQLWQGLENDLDISNILSYDWITLKNIAQLIAKSKNVHFIKEHQEIIDILKSEDRTKAGKTAASEGLYLKNVYY